MSTNTLGDATGSVHIIIHTLPLRGDKDGVYGHMLWLSLLPLEYGLNSHIPQLCFIFRSVASEIYSSQHLTSLSLGIMKGVTEPVGVYLILKHILYLNVVRIPTQTGQKQSMCL